MKNRLPRKLKKAMLTKQRLFDKSMGIKFRRSTMLLYMWQQYYTRLNSIKLEYNVPTNDKIVMFPLNRGTRANTYAR